MCTKLPNRLEAPRGKGDLRAAVTALAFLPGAALSQFWAAPLRLSIKVRKGKEVP